MSEIGRPEKLPPGDAHKIVLKLAARGCNETTIAYGLGIGVKTWRKWKKDHPELLEALELGRAREHDKLFGVLYRKAIKGDTIAAMFLLKCRHNYKEGSTTFVEDNRRIQIGIILPQSLTPEQYQQIVNIPLKEIEHDES
jgi:hypothetical protein